MLLAVDGGVATITLNRPRQRNAVGDGMARTLRMLCAIAATTIRVIVLPPPGFSPRTHLHRSRTGFQRGGHCVPAFTLSKPVIAAVNGHVLGLGLPLALQFDIRFFAADAQYGVVQVRRGVVGDADSHWILPRLVGISKAAEILLSGATFDAQVDRCQPSTEPVTSMPAARRPSIAWAVDCGATHAVRSTSTRVANPAFAASAAVACTQ